MKKNVYLTILTVVTVICIIAGSCYHIIGLGPSLFDNLISKISGKNYDSNWGSIVTLDDEPLEGEFDTVKIDIEVMELTIVPGDTATLSYECSKKLVPTYTIENNTLTLTQKSSSSVNIGFSMRSNKCNATLTLPQDIYYKNLELFADVGDITIEGLSGEHISLSGDVGDIDMISCDFKKTELLADVGDIDIENCTYLTLNIENSVGDVDVEGKLDFSDYNIELSTDVGEVEFNDKDYRHSFTQRADSEKSISIVNDTGDISLN